MGKSIRKYSPRSITEISLMAIFTAVAAQIYIPISPVPITLQVLAVLLSGAVLGSKHGAYSQILYIFLGLIGLPIFAGLKGGFQEILSPSFGYALAFPLASLITGLAHKSSSRLKSLFIFVCALIPIYLIGMGYLYIMFRFIILKPISFSGILAMGFLPFILPDILKTLLALLIFIRLKPLIQRRSI